MKDDGREHRDGERREGEAGMAHEESGRRAEPAAHEETAGAAAESTLRRARFGVLPERVRAADMVEEQPAVPRDPARDAYDPDEVAIRYGL
ncbi:hypothetical protein [Streptomyces sp. NPDC086787]|uniref:hypothetical protein n=1 Tax=Streptomyces sp. NPDC086787 TaxID=3365759 RepID=UPI0038147AEE